MKKRIELFGDGIGAVEYVSHMGDDRTIVNAARVSFGKEVEKVSEKDKKLINYLIKHNHTSTLEHCALTFRFKVPLFIRSQHHRHRTWSYNEISRRYTDFNLEFYEPKMFRKQSESNRQASVGELIDPRISFDGAPALFEPQHASVVVKGAHQGCLQVYNKLIEAGVCREQARGVLPQNLYTQYYGTSNLNNLFRFVDLRTNKGAQWEIQQVAKAVLEIASDLYPITVEAYQKIKKENNL